MNIILYFVALVMFIVALVSRNMYETERNAKLKCEETQKTIKVAHSIVCSSDDIVTVMDSTGNIITQFIYSNKLP